jgi:flagellar FliL protein
MADPVTKEKAKAAETPQPEAAQEIDKKSKGFPKNLITIGAIQVVMAVAAFFIVKAVILPRAQAGQANETRQEASAGHSEPGQIQLIDNIIVNPAGTNGTRYLSTSIGLEFQKSEETAKKMEELTPILRDILITILSSKSLDELSSPQIREQIRLEIQNGISAAISPEKVMKVYFVDYILQ